MDKYIYRQFLIFIQNAFNISNTPGSNFQAISEVKFHSLGCKKVMMTLYMERHNK